MSSYTKDKFSNFSNIKKTMIFDGIIVGVGAGLVSVSYRYLLKYLEKLCRYIYSFTPSPLYILGLICLLSLFGLIIGFLVKWAPLSSGSGIPQVQGELMGIFNMDEKKTIVAKYIGGSLAAIGGLSLGREGPSIQLGACSGKAISKFLRRDVNEQRALISAGASAGLAGAFSAPISGTIFVLEEMHKSFSQIILIPAIIASVIADYISKQMFGLSPVFSFSVKVPLSLSEYSHVIFLGVIIGVVGVSFNKTLLFIQSLYKKLPIKNEFKPIIAFMFAIIFGFSFPYVLGGGHPVIEGVVEHRTSTVLLIAILVLNLIFTAISYGSTAQGGIFLPVLVIGGIGGAIYYNIVKDFALIDVSHDYFVNFIVLAMAGMLSAVVRSPIISIMLVTEMTGSFEHILTLCMISIVSYLVAEMLKCKPIYESLLERMLGTSLQEDKDSFLSEKVLRQFVLSYDSKIINKKLKQVYLPLKSLIVSVERLGEEIIPKGDTVLKAGDRITVITDNKNLRYVTEYFENN